MNDLEIYQIFYWLLTFVIAIYMFITLKDYNDRKKKPTRNLGLMFLAHLIAMIYIIMVRYYLIFTNDLIGYQRLSIISLVFQTFGALFSLLFCAEIIYSFLGKYTRVSVNIKYYSYIITIICFILLALPYNYIPPIPSTIYMVFALHMIITNLINIFVFIKLYRSTLKRRTEMKILILSQVFFTFYIVTRASIAFIDEAFFYEMMIIFFHAAYLTGYFLGFYFPLLQEKHTLKSLNTIK